jgi:hypothetical protein
MLSNPKLKCGLEKKGHSVSNVGSLMSRRFDQPAILG